MNPVQREMHNVINAKKEGTLREHVTVENTQIQFRVDTGADGGGVQ